MFCPHCGRPLEESPGFCPWCGSELPGPDAAEGTIPPQKPKRSDRTAVAAAVAAIVVVAAALAAIWTWEGPRPTAYVGDGIVLYDSLADGSFDAVLDGNDLVITLSDSLSEGYGEFTWILADDTGAFTVYVVMEEPYVTLCLDNIRAGPYSLTVYRDGDSPLGGELVMYGTVTETYAWVYRGTWYTMSVSYDVDEYLGYKSVSGDGVRFGGSYSRASEMAVADGVVSSIESELRSLYLEAFGSKADTLGQGYADFILAFVQLCFQYSYDEDTYGMEEYWAYPVETVYHGGGDCEDTALLCAAIYKAAGYSAGVFIVPTHAVAAVALDDYTEPYLPTAAREYYDVFGYTLDGVTYYGCETTISTMSMQAGLISTEFLISEDGTVYYGGEASGQAYGLYTV